MKLVTLKSADSSTAGYYTCEIMSDAPRFETISKTGVMSLYGKLIIFIGVIITLNR